MTCVRISRFVVVRFVCCFFDSCCFKPSAIPQSVEELERQYGRRVARSNALCHLVYIYIYIYIRMHFCVVHSLRLLTLSFFVSCHARRSRVGSSSCARWRFVNRATSDRPRSGLDTIDRRIQQRVCLFADFRCSGHCFYRCITCLVASSTVSCRYALSCSAKFDRANILHLCSSVRSAVRCADDDDGEWRECRHRERDVEVKTFANRCA
jgi:hypothetical protein